MKKQFALIFFIYFLNTFSFAENWSNEKKYPTNLTQAKNFIFKHFSKITPSDAKFEYPYFNGIWYGPYLGWVGIYEEEHKSNKYKMFLIKAPKGYGLSKFPGHEPEKKFETHKDHEGTLEATLRKVSEYEYRVDGKIWYLQNDGSYAYENSTSKIEILSDGHFKWTDPNLPEEIRESNFIKLGTWLEDQLIKIDKSKDFTDFEIETSSGVFIYFDTKVKDHNLFGESVYDKFWNFDFKTGDVSTGQIVRELDGSFRNSIRRIYCVNKGSSNGLPLNLYYASSVPGEVTVNKVIKSKCDPNKISYSTYMHYKNKQYYWVGGISSLLIIIFLFLKINRSRELATHNSSNKNKFKTYAELSEYKQKIEERESIRKAKIEEKKRKAEEAKLEKESKAEEARIKAEERRLEREEKRKEMMNFKESENDYDDSLMDKVKRLKILYKNGTLSKAEFEKAKNKLLK